MFFLSCAGFVVYALDTDSLNDRVNVILTLLLTAVAFKLVIADSIPKVGYSTLIDDFVLYNMAFLFAQIIFCVVVHRLQNHADDDDEDADLDLMATHWPSTFRLSRELVEARSKLNKLSKQLNENPSLEALGTAEKNASSKLMKEISVTKKTVQTLRNSNWTVNSFIFAMSFVIFVGINIYWLYVVYGIWYEDRGNSLLETEQGRSWYSLSFADPSFLPSPISANERCQNKCPAGW